ncbi:MAG: hypothetical protein GY696_33830 [Gammaproteobacteria bacterium]|nr:hypothetical protein [Gammaproteobacteria bacterium]
MAGYLSRPLTLALMALLLVTMFFAAARGASGVGRFLIQQHMDSWTKNKQLPDRGDWDQVAGFFDWAYVFTPDNPGLLQLGGRLYEWRGEMAQTPENRALALDQALSLYEQSIALRPVWPHAWMDYAGTKLRLQQFDEHFQNAFQQAMALGPWEPAVQLGIARIGFAAGPALSRESRRELVANLQRTASVQPHKLLKLAEQQRQLLMVCYGVRDDQKVLDFCRKKGVLK